MSFDPSTYPPHQRLRMTLLRLAGEIKLAMGRILDPFDLTQPQLNVLRIVRGANQPLTVLAIRQRMLDRTTDVSRMVDRLVARELLQKTPCTSDRRLVDITLTPQGQDLLRQVDAHMAEVDALLGDIPEDEAAALADQLGRVGLLRCPTTGQPLPLDLLRAL